MLRNEEAEKDNLEKFMTNAENTISTVVTCSAGMAIRKLRILYFGSESPPPVSHFIDALTDLKKMITPKQENETTERDILSLSIENIFKLAKEDTNQYDNVTLYLEGLNGYGLKEFTFPIKEVLALVWKAIHDHEKYTHHYQGSEEEKLQQAKEQLNNRLENFYSCLEKLLTRPLCHQGTRHELIFVLNGTFKDINIIEDMNSTMASILKEGLNDFFWQKYNRSIHLRPRLITALLKWMEKSNPYTLFNLVDPQKTLYNKIFYLFRDHGYDSNRKEFTTSFDSTAKELPYSCDPKEQPIFAMIHLLLSQTDNNTYADKALRVKKTWIKTNYQIGNKQQEAIIESFYHFYIGHLNLDIHYSLFKVTEYMSEDFILFKNEQKNYFDLCITNNDFIVPDKIVDIAKSITLAKEKFKDILISFLIDKFFTLWFPKKNKEDLSILYPFLLDESIFRKIIIPEKIIPEFISKTEKPFSSFSYEINRIILHAILVNSDAWSKGFLELVRNILKNYAPSPENPSNQIPQGLIDQLTYLDSQRSYYYKLVRPGNMILLPQDIRTAEEWVTLSSLLTPQTLLSTYRRLEVSVNKILNEELAHADLNIFIPKVVPSIPTDYWLKFLRYIKRSLIERLKGIHYVSLLLTHVPDSKKLETLQILGIDWVRPYIQNHATLIDILTILPAKDKLNFIKLFQITHLIHFIENQAILAEMLLALPENSRFDFLKLFDTHTLNHIINSKEKLCATLSVLKDKDRYSFLKKLGIKNTLSIIKYDGLIENPETQLKEINDLLSPNHVNNYLTDVRKETEKPTLPPKNRVYNNSSTFYSSTKKRPPENTHFSFGKKWKKY